VDPTKQIQKASRHIARSGTPDRVAGLLTFSDALTILDIMRQSKWTASDEFGALIRIAKDSPNAKEQMQAIKMLHDRRQEALRQAGLLSTAPTPFPAGTSDLLTARPAELESETELERKVSDAQTEDSPNVSSPVESSGGRPLDADQPGLRGLAYHPTSGGLRGDPRNPAPPDDDETGADSPDAD
jgi:hypothetical protein